MDASIGNGIVGVFHEASVSESDESDESEYFCLWILRDGSKCLDPDADSRIG